MPRYQVQLSDLIFVKGYGFLSFAKKMGTNIGERIIKNLSGKYSQKILDHAKQSATGALKLHQKQRFKKQQKQQLINLLDNTPKQPTNFRTKDWVEINHELREKYNTKSQIRFKTSMLRLVLCDYSDA